MRRYAAAMLKQRALIVALVATAALAGCGGSGSATADYKKKVHALTTAFESKSAPTQAKLQSTTTPSRKAEIVDEIKAQYSTFASEFGRLTPPGGAQAAQAASVSAVQTVVADLGHLAAAARAGDQPRAQQAARALQADGPALTARLQELGAKLGGGN